MTSTNPIVQNALNAMAARGRVARNAGDLTPLAKQLNGWMAQFAKEVGEVLIAVDAGLIKLESVNGKIQDGFKKLIGAPKDVYELASDSNEAQRQYQAGKRLKQTMKLAAARASQIADSI